MTIAAVPIAHVQQGTAYITAGDGTAYILDESMLERVMQVLVEAQSGTATQDADNHPTEDDDLLTTGEAAHLLGVSAKTVGRILDAEEIPYIRYTAKGNRWVSRADVLAYRERAHNRHRTHLKNMQTLAAEGGLDDIDHDAYLAQFE
ncbi:helix-turn-helix domain-containing protein [Bifidobacterium criceti]|uniref:Excisionase family DNA binding domain-containing protein n=1 Tax=Bifidobacterium criceti TaxID=1960969 RepID=A0A2A2EBR5_9BIFI|nr:helix-turn-helix domain-containing protein [Bifidobacterium criceti]PAU66854.1 excisionase family DNA binding domain-containing protein [Bifidobacterium criceti]